MLTYYLPDITGVQSDYLRVNVPFFFWKAGIKIEFKASPIFMDSLRITTTDGLSTLLQQGVDYVVGDDDIDNDAMSRAFSADPGFTKTLIKSVTMKSTKGLGGRLAMLFQEFYLTTPNFSSDDGRPLEVTPDLIKWLISGQAALYQQAARVASPAAPVDTSPRLLPFDLNKERSGNVITGENADVNTVIGQKVIRPVQGLFFADSLEIKIGQTVLNKDTDYLPIDLSPLTKRSTNVSGVYRYIVLLKPITGRITISYHAVGGEVQQDDIQKAFDSLLAIKTFLDDSIFVTSETLPDTIAMRSAVSRIAKLENQVRILSSGTPNYEDSTAGLAILRPVRAANANHHWYTIASLYQVQGATDIILADQFKGRVFFPAANVTLAFTVDVNFNQTRHPVSFTTDAVVFDPIYTLFGDVSAAAPVYPLVRVIWDQSGQSFSGALIQIGLPLTNLQDTMAIEDLSTSESGWILNQTNRQIPGSVAPSSSAPEDNTILLPDGRTAWTSGNSTAKSRVFVPEYHKGYLVWTGTTVDLIGVSASADNEAKFATKLPNYMPLVALREIIVTLTSPDGSKPYDVIIGLNSNNGAYVGRVVCINNDGASLSLAVSIRLDGFNNVKLNIAATGAGTNSTDQIRYVRIRP